MELKQKTLDKKNVNFTKQHTQIAKGIAILLMVYHHLFVIPERLNCAYFSLPNVFGYDVQSIIANFSKICVCIFVFLSGIGLFYSLSKEKSIFSMYKKVGLKALSFMINFWVIALLVYPIGLMMGFFTFDFVCIIKVIFADYSRVAEWWFVRQYIVLLVISPIFVTLFKEKSSIYKRFLPLSIFCFCYFLVRILIKSEMLNNHGIFLHYFWLIENIPCVVTFFIGMIFAKFNLYSLYLKIPYNYLFSLLCIIMGCLCRFAFSNNPTSMRVDFFVVPLFVFGTTTLLVNTNISKFFEYFAKHSINIWLTHIFWCYYFFQDIVVKPYYSVFIYIWLLFLSLVSSYIINLIYIPISNWLFSKEHKLNYKNYFFFIMVKK